MVQEAPIGTKRASAITGKNKICFVFATTKEGTKWLAFRGQVQQTEGNKGE